MMSDDAKKDAASRTWSRLTWKRHFSASTSSGVRACSWKMFDGARGTPTRTRPSSVIVVALAAREAAEALALPADPGAPLLPLPCLYASTIAFPRNDTVGFTEPPEMALTDGRAAAAVGAEAGVGEAGAANGDVGEAGAAGRICAKEEVRGAGGGGAEGSKAGGLGVAKPAAAEAAAAEAAEEESEALEAAAARAARRAEIFFPAKGLVTEGLSSTAGDSSADATTSGWVDPRRRGACART